MNEQEKDKLFGEIGVDLGFLSTQDVNNALEKQKVDEAIGQRRPIGAYLHDSGKLDKDQIAKIIAMQEKVIKSQSSSVSAAPQNESKPQGEPLMQGYVFAVVALLFFPPGFGLAGFIVGFMNLSKGFQVHGIAQIVLSVIFGTMGMIIGASMQR